jgi:hypothetical protein
LARLSYHIAGSFVLHLTECFFQSSNRDETLDGIRARIQAVFGVSLDEIENGWLAMLRAG